MTTLFLDLETYSDVPITHGTHAYAERAEIMVAAWAWDDFPVQVDDLTAPAICTPIWLELAKADRVVIHNSMFDRTVLRANGIHLPAGKITDTMVLALQHALPGSLGKLCEILQIPTDQAKDKRGKSLINLFCKPRPKNQKLRRATRETHPAEWHEFLDYARLDIEAMRAVSKKLPRWNDTKDERGLWRLDQTINDRGVAIDMDLVRAAIGAVDRAQASLGERTRGLTDDAVRAATQRDAMLRHIFEAHGVALDDLRGSTVEKLLEDETLPADLRELLQVRLQASTTSVAKYQALARATSSDGRLRGTLQFCGASRTGRWAGRLFQPQNLPRPALKQPEIETGIDALKADCADLIFDNVMELTSAAIRGSIVAPPGKKLVVADLSNIEGRVLAWLAGEEWKLQAFRDFDRGEGPDLYKVTAGRILGKPAEQVTKLERQQVGKVAELALGYEGGVGAFITFATAYAIDLDQLAGVARETLAPAVLEESASAWDWTRQQKRNTFGLSQETWVAIDGIKRAWRKAHPGISSLWKDLGLAYRAAVEHPGTEIGVNRLSVTRTAGWARIILPSGRSLCYPSPAIGEDGKLSYMGIDQYTRRWQRIGTYGGKLVENVTQAVARDVLAHGMLEAEELGYRIVLSVHDELITECPDNVQFDAPGLASFMSFNPAWADGLPLSAAGFEAYRYKKGD